MWKLSAKIYVGIYFKFRSTEDGHTIPMGVMREVKMGVTREGGVMREVGREGTCSLYDRRGEVYYCSYRNTIVVTVFLLIMNPTEVRFDLLVLSQIKLFFIYYFLD